MRNFTKLSVARFIVGLSLWVGFAAHAGYEVGNVVNETVHSYGSGEFPYSRHSSYRREIYYGYRGHGHYRAYAHRPRRSIFRGRSPLSCYQSCSRRATIGNDTLALACNAYNEAGNLPEESQFQVNSTVMTRSALGGHSPAEVIWAHGQFSWTTHPKCIPYDPSARNAAYQAAYDALNAKPNGATNYYANYISRPDWAYNCRSAHISDPVHIYLICPQAGSSYASRGPYLSGYEQTAGLESPWFTL